MDPATAVGVAAGAFQFLDVALQALDLCQQVRASYDGATNDHHELDTHSQILKSLSADLVKSNRGDAAGQRISKIAQECVDSSGELLKVLGKVRRAGNAKLVRSLLSTARAMMKKDTIEELRQVMEKRRKLLDSALIQDLSDKVDMIALSQSQDFQKWSTNAQELGNKLATHQANMGRYHAETMTVLTTTQAQVTTLANRSENGHAMTHQALAGLSGDLNRHVSDTAQRSAHDELLTSLFFAEHMLRRENAASRHHSSTYEWIFRPDLGKPDDTIDTDGGHCSFVQWVRGSDSIYWINGKAGSGKSTLMAYIVGNKNTHEYLREWAADWPLHVFSFFFYSPGTELQKSIEGLLRSLLYQLLSTIPQLAEKIGKEFPFPHNRAPLWSAQKLTAMIDVALSNATGLRFCFFLDGLDEFEGDTADLFDIIFAIQRLAHIKLCVSSRPEPLLSQKLSHYAHLRMERLNFRDILTLASDRLAAFDDDGRLAHNLAHRADGVFLWAVLAVKSLIRGHASKDDKGLLFERLFELPQEMHDLFTKMLLGVDYVHRRRLGFFLRAMQLMWNPSKDWMPSMPLKVELLTAALMPGEITSYPPFWAMCKTVESQISTYSCGMLEVGDGPSGPAPSEPETTHYDCQTWELSGQVDSNSAKRNVDLAQQRRALVASRQISDHHDAAKTFAHYRRKTVGWVHRSAYEYILGLEDSKHSLQLSDVAETTRAIISGYLRLLIAAPSHSFAYSGPQYGSSVIGRECHLMNFLRTRKDFLTEGVGSVLDESLAYLKMFEFDELRLEDGITRYLVTVRDSDSGTLPPDFHDVALRDAEFWRRCVVEGFLEYVESRLESFASCKYGLFILAQLIEEICARLGDADSTSWSVPFRSCVRLMTAILSSILRIMEDAPLHANAKTLVPGRLVDLMRLDSLDISSYMAVNDGSNLYHVQKGGHTSLANAWWQMTIYLCSRLEEDCHLFDDPPLVDIIFMFLKALAHWQICLGTLSRDATHSLDENTHDERDDGSMTDLNTSSESMRDGNNRPVVVIQAPPCVFPDTDLWPRLPQQFKRRIQETVPTQKLDIAFRLLFRRREPKLRNGHVSIFPDVIAIFCLKSSMNRYFFEYTDSCFEEMADLVDVDKFRKALLKNIWRNPGRQLSGWQQVYAVASVRFYLKPRSQRHRSVATSISDEAG